MKYKVIMVICILLLIGLFGYTIEQYNLSHKAVKPVAMVPASSYQEALDVLKLHDAVSAQNDINFNAKIVDLTSKRDQLCTAIKTTKLVINPALCQ